MTITYRQVTEADRPLMTEIAGEVVAYYSAMDSGEEQSLSPEKLEEFVSLAMGEDPLCDCLLAEQDGQVQGYMAYFFAPFDRDRAFFIAGLFVRESGRGSGLGHLFMEKAKELAAGRKATRLVWHVWSVNEPAIRFYEGLGARFIADELLMTLVLD